MAQLHLWCRENEATVRKLPSQSDSSKVGIDVQALSQHQLLIIKRALFNGNVYALQEIEGVPREDSSGIAVEKYLDLITSRLQETINHEDELFCRHDKNPSSKMKSLSQFVSSVNMRSDAFIKLSRSGIDSQIPLLMVEIQSGDSLNSYKNTLHKATIGLIDQLRLLRHCDLGISKCSGFVFPKFSTYDSENRVVKDNKVYVTEVTVEWKDFHFCVNYAPLQLLDVRERVLIITTEMYSRCTTVTNYPDSLNYLIPLSPQDMQGLCACAGQTTCTNNELLQVKSRASIIVYCNRCSYLYKYVPSVQHEITLLRLTGRHQSAFILRPEMCFYYCNINFFKFKRLPHLPLNKDKAKLCLKCFISEVHIALTELHQSYFLAHLDVRLENICFNQTAQPVLIDLDRAVQVDTLALELLEMDKVCGDSLLYGRPVEVPADQWTVQHSDWKQFGKTM